jgi:hypothetical protein
MKNNNNNNSMESFEIVGRDGCEGAGERQKNSKQKLPTSFD